MLYCTSYRSKAYQPRLPYNLAMPAKLKRREQLYALASSTPSVIYSPSLVLHDLHRTVVIAVTAMWMVQMTGDEIVDMVAVWNRFVAATRSMNVGAIMPGAAMLWRATIRVLVAHLKSMFVHMVRMRMMKMAIVEIVHMVAVADGNVAAFRPMRMIVVGVMRKIAGSHFDVLSSQLCSPACAMAFSTSLNTWSSAIA